jgi:hypothetical protein
VKILALLFAVYTLLLPCFPCTDTGNCKDASKTEISSYSTDTKDHQHETEACSPFCSCACCGHIFIPNFQQKKIAIAKPITKQKKQIFYNNIFFPSSYFGNIWQPPKFS